LQDGNEANDRSIVASAQMPRSRAKMTIGDAHEMRAMANESSPEGAGKAGFRPKLDASQADGVARLSPD
jgi:hypothetical protein